MASLLEAPPPPPPSTTIPPPPPPTTTILPPPPSSISSCPIQFGSLGQISPLHSSILIPLPTDVITQARKVWENCLLINIGGLTSEIDHLHRKLAWLWKIRGAMNLSSMGHGFYLLTFDLLQDRWRALLHGPCIVFGHFISIRPWEPRFNPSLASKDSFSPVWARLHGLPTEYYDRRLLVGIGNGLGSFLATNDATHNTSKLSYARICIISNLSQPLPSSFFLDGFDQPLSFENAPEFCSSCKNINHQLHACLASKHARPPPPRANPPPNQPITLSPRQNLNKGKGSLLNADLPTRNRRMVPTPAPRSNLQPKNFHLGESSKSHPPCSVQPNQSLFHKI